jgi:tetratricopeptide (TPR) repeat protein
MSPSYRLLFPSWRWTTILLAIVAVCTALSFADQRQTPPLIAQAQQAQPAPLVSLTDGTPQELEREGDQLRSQKRYLDAVDYYDAALAKQQTALLWNKKGMALLFLQRNKDANKCFQHAVSFDKNSAEGWNNLGYIAHLEKRHNRAIKDYNKALSLRPNSATFHYNLGAAYFSKHEFDTAAQEYRTAYQLDPEIFQRVSRMGIMVQSSSPEDRAAFSFMVAKMYAQAGDLDHSLEYLRKAMEEGYKNIDNVYKDNEFATLRTDKRFTDLMAQKPQAIQ